MKTNKKTIGIISVISIVIIITIICIFTSSNNNTKTDKVIGYDEDKKILYEFENEKLIDAVEKANMFKYLTIRKHTNEITYDKEGNPTVEHLELIVSDINFTINEDCTINSLKLKDGEDPFAAPRLNFEETFGFDYNKCENVFAVIMKMAKENGISTDLENAELNEKTFEITGQENYTLKNSKDLPIIQEMLASIEYDKILETKVVYDLVYYDGSELEVYTGPSGYSIHNITASIMYEKNGVQKIKNITYTFGLHFEEWGWEEY